QLEMAFDPAQERDRMVRAFVVRHAAALPADGDDRADALNGAEIDELTELRLELVVDLGMNDPVLERDGPGSREQRLEPVAAQRRPLLGRNQIEAVNPHLGGEAAHLVERQRRVLAEIDFPQPLTDTPAAPPRG